MTMVCLVACANKVSHVNLPLYHYIRTNVNASSAVLSRHHVDDIVFNVERVSSFIRGLYGSRFDRELSFFRLNAKLPFIITDDNEYYTIWQSLWPESNAVIMENENQPLRTRLVQVAAARGLFWITKLYYRVVHKFVYGKLYR